jgi:toxin ParE1/3/4
MTGKVIFRSAAEADLQEAYEWYEERERGLGAQFVGCVDDCIRAIQRHPEMYPEVDAHIRQGVLRRFPYLLLYFKEGDDIIVLSVFHAARDPKVWKRRS